MCPIQLQEHLPTAWLSCLSKEVPKPCNGGKISSRRKKEKGAKSSSLFTFLPISFPKENMKRQPWRLKHIPCLWHGFGAEKKRTLVRTPEPDLLSQTGLHWRELTSFTHGKHFSLSRLQRCLASKTQELPALPAMSSHTQPFSSWI